ncbi:hypothetical protein AQJ46_00605 [Streptomyces canus]|uniref:Uncharacterized protein n=1 Tax=Streptomyces canus TaxID=58343 RepID=A0A117R6U3_9ACTN|nr:MULTISPECIES: hypothetical protein [Streptomyces]KUN74128.1 hypothetical protein AQJ46_00605 [Streptomyces canus]MDI5910429.1 hypothetical protein [Streptomyces sp. 12257]
MWRQWTVVERRTRTPSAGACVLRPADGVRRLRQYSLSSDPSGDVRQSTVKRVAGTVDAREGRWPGA